MKKVLFIACMLVMSVASFAQQGATSFGIHGNYLIDSPNNVGIGANVGYEFVDNFRGVAEFNYFFKTDEVSIWNVEVNAEYLFRLSGSQFTIYPLAGIDILGWSVSGNNQSKMGLNIGGGVEYAINSNLSLKAEYNYKTQYDGNSVLKLGVVIPF